MGDSQETIRHNIYLADSVWRALRQRAILEQSSANTIITYLLERFLQHPAEIPATRYKARLPETSLDGAKGRTVRIPAEVSERVMRIVRDRTSLASLIDYLLRQYLVIELYDQPKENTHTTMLRESNTPAEPGSQVKVGGTTFDLGDHPFTLDPKTGKIEK